MIGDPGFVQPQTQASGFPYDPAYGAYPGTEGFVDPGLYGKDFGQIDYTNQQTIINMQQEMFTRHRIDEKKSEPPFHIHYGCAVMEDNGQTNLDWELEWFIAEDGYDPLQSRIEEAKKQAQEFMQEVKSKFPNRYFILKKMTENSDLWPSCALERNYIVFLDESSAKKLQNCYEVIIASLLSCLLAESLLNRFLTTYS
jgi:hypothetical protein